MLDTLTVTSVVGEFYPFAGTVRHSWIDLLYIISSHSLFVRFEMLDMMFVNNLCIIIIYIHVVQAMSCHAILIACHVHRIHRTRPCEVESHGADRVS